MHQKPKLNQDYMRDYPDTRNGSSGSVASNIISASGRRDSISKGRRSPEISGIPSRVGGLSYVKMAPKKFTPAVIKPLRTMPKEYWTKMSRVSPSPNGRPTKPTTRLVSPIPTRLNSSKIARINSAIQRVNLKKVVVGTKLDNRPDSSRSQKAKKTKKHLQSYLQALPNQNRDSVENSMNLESSIYDNINNYDGVDVKATPKNPKKLHNLLSEPNASQNWTITLKFGQQSPTLQDNEKILCKMLYYMDFIEESTVYNSSNQTNNINLHIAKIKDVNYLFFFGLTGNSTQQKLKFSLRTQGAIL